ncbi:MAG: hypothetical protein AAFZ89_15490 [Bacteroidota bacterium]
MFLLKMHPGFQNTFSLISEKIEKVIVSTFPLRLVIRWEVYFTSYRFTLGAGLGFK